MTAMRYGDAWKTAMNDFKLATGKKPLLLLVHPSFYAESLKEFFHGEPTDRIIGVRYFDCEVVQDPKVETVVAVEVHRT